MSCSSLYELCALLGPFIKSQTTYMHFPVTVETQVTVVLYYLSHEGRLRKVAYAFGISRSSCSIIIRRVSKVITTHLGPLYVKLPVTEESDRES
uniref:Transposase Helix-turn-helix domain-containing protein n=1 Tax=Amphimedon queenslandica TaxID=400682 RepID=A0A1X7UGV6_AMPQE